MRRWMRSLLSAAILLSCAIGPTKGDDDPGVPGESYIAFDPDKIGEAYLALTGADLNVDSLAVLVDGQYAGQITDEIDDKLESYQNIGVAVRADGGGWLDNTSSDNAIDAYKIFEIQHSEFINSCDNKVKENCKDVYTELLENYLVEEMTKDDVTLISITAGYPDRSPRENDYRTIEFQTEPEGAELVIRNRRFWKPTNCVVDVPETHEPFTVTFRLDGRSSGPIEVSPNQKHVVYRFD